MYDSKIQVWEKLNDICQVNPRLISGVLNKMVEFCIEHFCIFEVKEEGTPFCIFWHEGLVDSHSSDLIGTMEK